MKALIFQASGSGFQEMYNEHLALTLDANKSISGWPNIDTIFWNEMAFNSHSMSGFILQDSSSASLL